MNKTKYLALAFAALTLGACTSDDVVSTGGGKDDGNATGYLSFAINLPTMSGNTRAGWGDGTGVFDDGEESEYAVRDARVYFINSKGTIIQTSTPVLSWTGTPSDQNVTKVSAVVTLESPLTDPASVLVVLNPSSKLPAVTDDETKYSDFNDAITTAATDFCTINPTSKIAENIMMTNAPIVEDDTSEEASAGDKIVQTLVPITADDIKTTEEASVAAPVTVYVERVLAKVTVGIDRNFKAPDGATFLIEHWGIDNTNTTTYPVRNTDFYAKNEKDFLTDINWALSGVNRFYGKATNPVRTYFAEDPNYDTDGTLSCVGTAAATLSEEQPGYCLENTFDLSKQIDKAATYVLLKATYKPTNLGEDYKDGDNFFIMGSRPTTILTASELAEVIEEEMVKDVYDFVIDGTLEVNEDKLKSATATDRFVITADLFTNTVTEKEQGAFEELTDALMIKVYNGGVSYYPIPIKHFGDALTPWTSGSYGTGTEAEKKYLGRYGVVRNNWYEINIKSVSGPGEPVPPTPGDEQIDKDERYISFTVNILSWAKRTQDVEL